jgi:hypothetical protein
MGDDQDTMSEDMLTPQPVETVGEEYHGTPRRTWLFIFILSVAYLGWTALIYTLIGDPERVWQHGSRPDVPGEAWVATDPPQPAEDAQMLQPPGEPTPKENPVPDNLLAEPRPFEERP